MTPAYSMRSETSRQSTALCDLSWEHVWQVTLLQMAMKGKFMTQSMNNEDQLYRNTKKHSVSIGQQEPLKKPSELGGDTQVFLEEAVEQGEHGGRENSWGERLQVLGGRISTM